MTMASMTEPADQAGGSTQHGNADERGIIEGTLPGRPVAHTSIADTFHNDVHSSFSQHSSVLGWLWSPSGSVSAVPPSWRSGATSRSSARSPASSWPSGSGFADAASRNSGQATNSARAAPPRRELRPHQPPAPRPARVTSSPTRGPGSMPAVLRDLEAVEQRLGHAVALLAPVVGPDLARELHVRAHPATAVVRPGGGEAIADAQHDGLGARRARAGGAGASARAGRGRCAAGSRARGGCRRAGAPRWRSRAGPLPALARCSSTMPRADLVVADEADATVVALACASPGLPRSCASAASSTARRCSSRPRRGDEARLARQRQPEVGRGERRPRSCRARRACGRARRGGGSGSAPCRDTRRARAAARASRPSSSSRRQPRRASGCSSSSAQLREGALAGGLRLRGDARGSPPTVASSMCPVEHVRDARSAQHAQRIVVEARTRRPCAGAVLDVGETAVLVDDRRAIPGDRASAPGRWRRSRARRGRPRARRRAARRRRAADARRRRRRSRRATRQQPNRSIAERERRSAVRPRDAGARPARDRRPWRGRRRAAGARAARRARRRRRARSRPASSLEQIAARRVRCGSSAASRVDAHLAVSALLHVRAQQARLAGDAARHLVVDRVGPARVVLGADPRVAVAADQRDDVAHARRRRRRAARRGPC